MSVKSFFSTLLTDAGKLFSGAFDSVLGPDQGKTLEAGVVAFVKTDVGALAVDAVNYVSALPGGQTNDQLRAAAVAKLKADLQLAGKDVSTLATSTLNLFIELAFTYVAGLVVKLPSAIK